MAKAVYCIVRGRVQGVGFRWFTVEQADKLGLTGWVKNRDDGSVEAIIEGPDADVDQMLAWLEHGPGWARVASVTTQDRPVQGFTSFDISY